MIQSYNKSDYADMREFYFQILYESRHFLPYTPTMDKGLFNSPERHNFIIRDDKIIAHLTVFKINAGVFDVGVAVLQEHYGKGLGSQMLDYAETVVRNKGGNRIVATIHPDNWRSILLFVKRGYKIINEENNLKLEKILCVE